MTLSYPELSRICRGFAMLLRSGISAADGAFLLAREEQPPIKALLQSLGEALDRGMPLSEALSDGFPAHFRTMVRIGEETGKLEEALNALADSCDERCRTLQQLRSAVTYPALVLALMLLVVGVLLVKVLPIFDRVYISLGSRLMGLAAGLLYAGQLLKAALPGLFALLLILAAGAVLLYLRPGLRKKLQGFWNHRFGDRGISRKFNNARFARALAMGLASGLNLDTCMALAEDLLKDKPGAARRCAQCAKAMEAGEPIGPAMERFGLLPPSLCAMVQIGHRCGSADRVMAQIADTLAAEAQAALEDAISGIEPVMVLISSILVGLILLSVMLPLADILAVLR